MKEFNLPSETTQIKYIIYKKKLSSSSLQGLQKSKKDENFKQHVLPKLK